MNADPWFDAEFALAQLGQAQGTNDFKAVWSEKSLFNVPGPVYVGDDDSCGTGPEAAPNNVHLYYRQPSDPHSWEVGEFVYRQPTNLFETGQIIRSTEVNTMSAYGMDGNAHWTRTLVEGWWRDMQDVVRSLQDRSGNRRAYPATNPPHWLTHEERRWFIYLVGDCHRDLRRYIAFLETGIAPDGNALPSLIAPRRGLRLPRGLRQRLR